MNDGMLGNKYYLTFNNNCCSHKVVFQNSVNCVSKNCIKTRSFVKNLIILYMSNIRFRSNFTSFSPSFQTNSLTPIQNIVAPGLYRLANLTKTSLVPFLPLWGGGRGWFGKYSSLVENHYYLL